MIAAVSKRKSDDKLWYETCKDRRLTLVFGGGLNRSLDGEADAACSEATNNLDDGEFHLRVAALTVSDHEAYVREAN